MKSIILHDDEVRTLLETGAVEVARRIRTPDTWNTWGLTTCGIPGIATWQTWDGSRDETVRCPLGAPGERRWVKECACHKFDSDGDTQEVCAYRADVPKEQWGEHKYHFSAFEAEWCPAGHTGWRSAVHMVHDDSRLAVECTAVRVDRRDGVWHWVAQERRVEGTS